MKVFICPKFLQCLRVLSFNCVLAFSAIASTNAVTAQETGSEEGALTLPMPVHQDRIPENAEVTRPKESQPNRDTRSTATTRRRTSSNMPIPGRPSRNLPPLGEPEEATDSISDDELQLSEEQAGLLRRLPRQWLDGGINAEYIYTGETFTKARGGITSNRATNYRSNLDLVATLDTAKMGWWDNGRLFVYGQNLAGQPLSAEHVGDIQLFSNLDSTISETDRPHFTAVAEYWYEHLLLDGQIRIKVGKQDTNADFALCDLGGDFVNSSFGLPPMIPLPTFPSQALGIAAFFNLTENLIFGIGAFDGTPPSGPQGVRWGFDTLGHNGAISLYQLEWKPAWGASGQYPTTIRTGMWHHSADDLWTELTASPSVRTFNQNYGIWTTADQIVWKESDGDGDDQGLGVFGQFGWAPGNRNVIQEYYGGGLVYKGLIPGRDDDLIGLAVANALLSTGFRAQGAVAGDSIGSNETVTEIFYKYQVSPFVSLQPDLQYIGNPGGLYRDALLPGLRFEVVF